MLPVKILDPLPLSEIPAEARRKRDEAGDEQLLTTYVLNDLLKPRVPKDAVTLIAITPADLWPGEGWNFVFGQASLARSGRRVVVPSLWRSRSKTTTPFACAC